MSRPKKPRNKPYRPRRVRFPLVVAAQTVMAPLDRIIDQIRHDGTVNVDAKGTAIFQDGDGQWYDTAAGLEGIIWHLEMYSTRHHIDLPIQPLRELMVCLRYVSPVSAALLSRLQDALPRLQRAMALGCPDDQVDILQQARIKEAFEGVAL